MSNLNGGSGGPKFEMEQYLTDNLNKTKGSDRIHLWGREGNYHEGLTKREYFAAMAMEGELASQSAEIGEYSDDASIKLLGIRAVKMADSLIEALNRK